MTGLIIFLVVFTGFLTWLRFSVWRVKPGEIGARIILGSLDGHICRPGFHLIPKFFGCGMLRISSQYTIDFPLITAFSGATSGCESEPLPIAVTLYLKFPQDARIRDVIQGGMPTSQDGLLKRLDPIVSEEVQSVFNKASWRVAIVNLDISRQAIELGLASRELFSDFIANGGTFNIAIESVDLPDALKQALSYHEQMKIGSEAVKKATDANVHLSNRSFISGQVCDGQTTRFLNLVGEASEPRALGQIYTAASRLLQKENGQQRKGKGGGGRASNDFRREDYETV